MKRTSALSPCISRGSHYKHYFLFFNFILFYLTLQYCIGLAIYHNESRTFPAYNARNTSQ